MKSHRKSGKRNAASSRGDPQAQRTRKGWFLLIGVAVCAGVVGLFVARPFWPGDETSQDTQDNTAKLAEKKEEPPVALEPTLPEPAAVPPEPSAPPPERAATLPETAATPPEAAATPPEAAATPEATIAALKKEQIEVAGQLISDFPNRPGPIGIMGRLNEDCGNTEAAIECWQRCAQLDSNSSEPYYHLGRLAMRRAEHEKAVALWRKALEIDPTRPGVYYRIASALTCLGKPEESLAALKKDVEITPRAFHGHFLLGQAYLQLKDYQKAKKHYQTVIEINPNHANAYYGLAKVCARLGEKEEAKRHREKFKALQERDLQARKDRNVAFDELRFGREAAAGTYTEIGRYYGEHGNARKAERLWRRAATLDPKNKNCRLHLTALYRAAGRSQAAVEVYEELRQIEPEDALIYAEIGLLNVRMGQFDAAEGAFRKIIELAPQRPEGYSWLAQLYLRTNKNFSEAKVLAATTVRLVPTADNYSILGEACDRSGDRAGALSALKRALELDPDSEKYKRIYRQIEQRE